MALEWEGTYAHDRHIIEQTFARTRERTMVMLVADDGDALIGQIWIDFARRHGIANLWALRVKPSWRGRGIGTELLHEAERVSAARGSTAVELEVEHANVTARRLYERLGYARVRGEGSKLVTLRKEQQLRRTSIVEGLGHDVHHELAATRVR